MVDDNFALSQEDRRRILTMAANKLARPASHLEKDIWVVWCLQTLFAACFDAALVFKGGTSLSKAFLALIKRFSEDVDLACVLRYFAPDLEFEIMKAFSQGNPYSRNMPNVVRERLKSWVMEQLLLSCNKNSRKLNLWLKYPHGTALFSCNTLP